MYIGNAAGSIFKKEKGSAGVERVLLNSVFFVDPVEIINKAKKECKNYIVSFCKSGTKRKFNRRAGERLYINEGVFLRVEFIQDILFTH